MYRSFIVFCVMITSVLALRASVKPDFIVDRNGRGDYRNIADVLEVLKDKDPTKTVTVYIRNGFYKEKLELDSTVQNVHFIGESKERTIINYDDHANIDNMRTFRTYTFKIGGRDFLFENLTFENTALQLGQAVAVHLTGDRTVFKNCRFLGNQDTIYAGEAGSRYYFEACHIEGTTDFIFGPATAYFYRCDILCKKNSYITAPNTSESIKYGFILDECTIHIDDGVTNVFLGRPWRPFGMTLFKNCYLPAEIDPLGWDNWRNEENEKTARFMEFKNNGEGANHQNRVKWSRVLTPQEAQDYTLYQVLAGDDHWNPLSISQEK